MSFVEDFQVAGTCLVISLSVNRKPHVVVYDYVAGTWEIVLSHLWNDETSPLPWERLLESLDYGAIMYLEARPGLRLGLVDCPMEVNT